MKEGEFLSGLALLDVDDLQSLAETMQGMSPMARQVGNILSDAVVAIKGVQHAAQHAAVVAAPDMEVPDPPQEGEVWRFLYRCGMCGEEFKTMYVRKRCRKCKGKRGLVLVERY